MLKGTSLARRRARASNRSLVGLGRTGPVLQRALVFGEVFKMESLKQPPRFIDVLPELHHAVSDTFGKIGDVKLIE